jgi:hypothetical protein
MKKGKARTMKGGDGNDKDLEKVNDLTREVKAVFKQLTTDIVKDLGAFTIEDVKENKLLILQSTQKIISGEIQRIKVERTLTVESTDDENRIGGSHDKPKKQGRPQARR